MTWILLIIVAVIVAAWIWLDRRVGPRPAVQPFDGDAFSIGAARVYRRGPADADGAVIAVHGFCENPGYFKALYVDPQLELILVGNADYHPVPSATDHGAPPWASVPESPPGTIGYEAEVVIQAAEHLARAPLVRVHGHSRGGAVLVEAARRRPDLFANAQAVLEAPVLPQARQPRELPAPVLLFLPLLLPLWRRQPINPRNKRLWGDLSDAGKRDVIRALPFNPRRAVTMRRNLGDIATWVRKRSTEDLQHLPDRLVLVPEHDRILDPAAMRRSAEAGGARVAAVAGSSHFVALDVPEAIPPVRVPGPGEQAPERHEQGA
ncbi:alpha/beta hydrolase [Aquisalimonas asiatica]|uniref:Pimeloyl-ACP methyl ester carboxylesterase n=1 Tax=Aquisalimonas asiatica TaxID=406100 RepID=A0A1H8UM21_9GAMM|nr:alpha/beta hydrolase [Aquisalimonas asiatica]SEP04265.1 Pimeloyl-ACP methyl ester carboxylesterase [Aquisalimonas asiatica]